MTLLSCEGIDLSYGQVQILFGVDFEVAEGEMVALLGTNGAGKSTLLRAICGTAPVCRGRISFAGENITNVGPLDAASRGIVQVPGGKGVFPSMTVGENLRVATWLYRREVDYVEDAVHRVLEMFPILRARFDQPAGNMSGGEQQMLTLAQAFVAKPKLLLIDELSLGLAPAIVQDLLEVVRAVHREGVTVVLVEQSVNVALTVCQRAVFLEKGEVRFGGPTADLLERPDILRSVFLAGATDAAGNGVSRARDRAASPALNSDQGAVVLEARDLTKHFGGIRAVDGVDLELREGEILGLIGSNGAGKTTILDLLSGFLVPDSGTIRIRDRDVTTLAPDARARAGLGRSFQDARLFPSLTVGETIAVAVDRHLPVRGVLAAAVWSPAERDAEEWVVERVEALIELMGLGAFRDKFISELSTGSRRIVDIACTLAHEPDVLLLDEPSSGIAQRETEALAPLLLRIQTDLATSLLVIEHDMPLISSISDRLIALETGRQIATGPPQDVLADPVVVASYLGTNEAVVARSGVQARTSHRRRAK